MAKQVVWTLKAKDELIHILQYWIDRNKSKTFSIKLNKLIEEQLQLITEYPEIGRKTDFPNVYVKIVQKYLLYYTIEDDTIYILTFRHGRKDTKNLNI